MKFECVNPLKCGKIRMIKNSQIVGVDYNVNIKTKNAAYSGGDGKIHS